MPTLQWFLWTSVKYRSADSSKDPKKSFNQKKLTHDLDTWVGWLCWVFYFFNIFLPVSLFFPRFYYFEHSISMEALFDQKYITVVTNVHIYSCIEVLKYSPQTDWKKPLHLEPIDFLMIISLCVMAMASCMNSESLCS